MGPVKNGVTAAFSNKTTLGRILFIWSFNISILSSSSAVQSLALQITCRSPRQQYRSWQQYRSRFGQEFSLTWGELCHELLTYTMDPDLKMQFWQTVFLALVNTFATWLTWFRWVLKSWSCHTRLQCILALLTYWPRFTWTPAFKSKNSIFILWGLVSA
jgi:hypothetical protein